MKINALCKQLALQEVFAESAVQPGGGLPYYKLQQLWERTGLRKADLEDAIADAIGSGTLAELYSRGEHTTMLIDTGIATAARRTHAPPQSQARALSALRMARERRASPRSGRRSADGSG